jgi:hypothetical protein
MLFGDTAGGREDDDTRKQLSPIRAFPFYTSIAVTMRSTLLKHALDLCESNLLATCSALLYSQSMSPI